MTLAALLVLAVLPLSPSMDRRSSIGASPVTFPASVPEAQGASIMHHASGTFEVKIKPEVPSEVASSANLGRMSIDKQFHGALEAVSKGEMLSILDKEKGSGGYVALERVTGTLDGKAGSFALQHTAIMDRGKPSLSVTVVPDSGTGELRGITGSMTIIIEAGKHSYAFDYTL